MEQKVDLTIRILTIGNSGVGKTCLISRYVDNCFSHRFMSTIGVDFKTKQMKIGDRNIRVQIWDTAGQDRFRNITGGYYRKAHGVAIVFDVTNQTSFSTISQWVKEISMSAPENTVKILIANKTDMLNLRTINENDGRALSQEYNLYYFETSAKDDVGVNEAFDFMVNRIYSNIEKSALEISGKKWMIARRSLTKTLSTCVGAAKPDVKYERNSKINMIQLEVHESFISNFCTAEKAKSRKFLRKREGLFKTCLRFKTLGALCSCLAVVSAGISYEHTYAEERVHNECKIIEENTILYRLSTMLLSYLAIIFELLYKHLYFSWEKLYPLTFEELPPVQKKTFLDIISLTRPRSWSEYLKSKHTWLVILMNLLFPYPGVNIKLKITQMISYEKYEICYYLEEFLYFFMFFRFFHLILALCAYGKFQTPIAQRILEENHVSLGASFSFRCYAKVHPVFVISFLLLVPGIIVFGIGIRVFERPLQMQDLNSIENSMWLVLVTMTTVGYGDRIPYSICSRIVVCLAVLWGGLSLSLTFVTIGNFLRLQKKEKSSFKSILANRESGSIISNILYEKMFYEKKKIKGIKLVYYNTLELLELNEKRASEQTLKFRSYEKMLKNIGGALEKADDITNKLIKIKNSFRPRRSQNNSSISFAKLNLL